MENIQLIGHGNLWKEIGLWIAKYIEEKNIWNKVSLHVLDKMEINKTKYRDFSSVLIQEGISQEAELVILAVKPQHLDQINLSQFKASSTLVSVLAGTYTETLRKKSVSSTILRAMPNLLVQSGKSSTGIYISWKETQETSFMKEVFSQAWSVIEYQDEELLHEHTALFGSWPGIVARLIGDFTEIAMSKNLWVSEEKLYQNILMMFWWVAEHLRQKSLLPNDFFSKVASKGWTTEAFGDMWEICHGGQLLRKSIDEAIERSKKLASSKHK